jgi:hypothetical protein
LDAEDRVFFPGSPGVWMAAAGAKVSADEEDALIRRMLRTAYQRNGKGSDIDAFRAVEGIGEHHVIPLNQDEALLPAKNCATFAGIYPYFTTLTALTFEDYRKIFTLSRLTERSVRRTGAGVLYYIILLEFSS